MSTNKDLITGLCSGTQVSTYRFTSNRQQAHWKGPMDGSTLGSRQYLQRPVSITGGKLNAKENSSLFKKNEHSNKRFVARGTLTPAITPGPIQA